MTHDYVEDAYRAADAFNRRDLVGWASSWHWERANWIANFGTEGEALEAAGLRE